MTTIDKKKYFSYESAGVNIQKGNALVDKIKTLAQKTHRPGVLGGIGGFSGLFELPTGYKHPVLVSGTDGVGTKLKLAIALNRHNTIGIDLVAMCVNDVITCGAKPLFFLDYYASGELNPTQAEAIIQGIITGCQQADITLLGGETAEMPGLYHDADYDLAGFCVGVIEKKNLIDGRSVRTGDILIALASSGVHANGYSLIRQLLQAQNCPLSTPFEQSTLGETLLNPTRIYAAPCQQLQNEVTPHAIAHITGGGLIENVPRVLPHHTRAVIDVQSWRWPPIFRWIQERGTLSEEEMWRTFNLGVGLVLCIDPAAVDLTLNILTACGEQAWVLGHIAHHAYPEPTVSLIK